MGAGAASTTTDEAVKRHSLVEDHSSVTWNRLSEFKISTDQSLPLMEEEQKGVEKNFMKIVVCLGQAVSCVAMGSWCFSSQRSDYNRSYTPGHNPSTAHRTLIWPLFITLT